ncbi:MAG: LamG-like jellyroll fold domain-containing protein, partial [Eubacteriales bacterium]
VELVDSDRFTVKIALGELEYPGTSYISFIISDNDNFSLFIRTAGDFLEFKGSGNARPKVEGGADLANNSTVAITFDLDGDVCMYVDGECIGSATTTENIVADTLFLGHYDVARNWIGDVYSIRFYDRALTAEEIAQNAAADTAKYRTEAAPVREEAPVEEAPVEAEPAAEEPAVIEAEVPAAEETIEPVAAAAPSVPVTEAPQTFDMGILAAVAALVSAAGYAVSKKR